MEPGDIIADRFEIECLAGEGGMGAVYRATDRVAGGRVAVKVLLEGASRYAERFAQEARVLAGVHHPGVVGYVAHGVTLSGLHYLAMEWLEGEDLAARLARAGMSLADSVVLVSRVAAALAAVHARGVLHRDLKPRNIFLPGGDVSRARVLDFGIARDVASAALTRTGVTLGTPGYLAPEQARGERELTPAVDVFAVACVWFECITSRSPFKADNVMAMLAKVLFEDTPRLRDERPDLPADIDELMFRMLAKDPAARPRDGAALVDALEALTPVPDGRPSAVSEVPRALTAGEKRLFCVVAAASSDNATTVVTSRAKDFPSRPDLSAVAHTFGGRVESLADGSLVVGFAAGGTATDQVTRAARCALALQAIAPDESLAMATGWGHVARRTLVGEVIDRAIALALDVAPPGPLGRRVRLDDMTAGLLGDAFEVGEAPAHRVLLRASEAPAGGARTLLGRPSPMVGRNHELGALKALWDDCIEEGAARVVVVTGAAGMGKSRLLQGFLAALPRGMSPPRVLLGRGDLMRPGAPFGVLASALRGAVDASRASPFLRELLGLRSDAEESAQLAAARRDARLMGDQMRRAWEDWLRAECDAQPVVLAIEDLQWGDLPSVQFIDGALRALRDRPLMVVAVARPEVTDVFPGMWHERGAREVRLSELGARASERLVRTALGDDVSTERVAELVERAGGNPLYLEELVRAEADGRGSALPDTVLAMVQARFESMEPDSRHVLRAASVFGGSFRVDGVKVLVGKGLGAPAVDAWVAELERREVIARRADSDGEGDAYAFVHTPLRDAAYGTLLDADRALGHRLAGAWLARSGERDALVLAQHFERGGQRAQAAEWYRGAAEYALAGNDLDAALTQAGKAVACGATGETLGAVCAIRAAAHKWRGEAERAKAESIEALRLLRRGSAAWYTASKEYVAACGNHGDIAALLPMVATLCGSDEPASGARVVAAAQLAVHLTLAGKAEAVEVFTWLETARGQVGGDPVALGAIDEADGFRVMVAGDPAECMRAMNAAADRREEGGDMRGACVARVNAAFAAIELGALDDAERALRTVLALAEGDGLAVVAAHARQNLVPVLTRKGCLEEARAHASITVEAYHAWKSPRPEGTARMYLAEVLAAGGALDDAERELRAALELLADVPTKRALALAMMANVRRAQGAIVDALATAREAAALLESIGGVDEGEAVVRLSLVEALVASGDHDAARTAAGAAKERLLARAARIADAVQRERFLSSVAENATTLTLARSLCG